MKDSIGERLVPKKLLSQEQHEKAREESKLNGTRLGLQITKLGFVQETELADVVSNQFGVPSISLDDFEFSPEVVQLIP